ncbi:STAS domain-containing protein [Modestobacter sp. NPDC049651]|uniref:STAS domain-containing protein n=1 Tax=unclassified Modestobacter TaxID=2643866 RepID=UPI0033CFC48B
MHVVQAGAAPMAESVPVDTRRLVLSLHQRSVVLTIGGMLNADTAGRVGMFLSMFTGAGGPEQLVLDLSAVITVDAAGMAPIHDADASMRSRQGDLRLASVSSAVARHLLDVDCGSALVIDDGDPRHGRD